MVPKDRFHVLQRKKAVNWTINDLNNLRTEVENAFYQNENNNDTTWNTPESFYKSIA